MNINKINKILVVDNFDVVIIAVKNALEEITDFEIIDVKYYDDAYLKIKKAQHDNIPFNLLISDSSYKTDFRNGNLSSGKQLISSVRKLQPDIKIIVYSDEHISIKIKHLFNKLNINAFVYKGSNSIQELKNSVLYILNENIIGSFSCFFQAIARESIIEIEEYDISLLELLSKGLTIKEIAFNFNRTGIVPNSISSIEKHIDRLKINFIAKNIVHLIAIAKERSLI